jgi:hypothetical protein
LWLRPGRGPTELVQVALESPQTRFEHLALFLEILDVILSHGPPPAEPAAGLSDRPGVPATMVMVGPTARHRPILLHGPRSGCDLATQECRQRKTLAIFDG